MAARGVAVAGALLFAACGRISFDAHNGTDDAGTTGAGDAATPTANIVFVTSTTHVPGSLGGLAGADAICSARAREAGFTGTFVAYLSTSTINAPARLRTARGWIRPDGKMVADQVDDLVVGNLVYSIGLDERGVDVAGGPMNSGIWVSTGTSYGDVSMDNCADFTDPALSILAGGAGMVHQQWMTRATFSCAVDLRLYCFEIDRTVPLTITPSAGRLAFVSTGMFSPTSGIAAADAICANEAAMANRAGTFLALLPNGAPSVSRFDITGAPWVRADGVRLADTNDAFMNGYAQAALDVAADGTRVTTTYVQVGSQSPSFTNGADCAGWSSSGGTSNYGDTYSAGGWMFNDTSSNCTNPQPVYCLEL